jgi:hypothetical protein
MNKDYDPIENWENEFLKIYSISVNPITLHQMLDFFRYVLHCKINGKTGKVYYENKKEEIK